MEKRRLRSSLKTSADEFLSSAVKVTLKSSKPSLKTFIFAVEPSSDLSSSLPLALHHSILQHTESFQKLAGDDDNPCLPSPFNSPPSKRHQGDGSGPSSDLDQRRQQILGFLQVLAHTLHLCVLSPRKAFSTSDLLPAAQVLHNNLILFESDPVLCLEIAGVCECWWKEGLVERETLISQSLPFLLWRSLTRKKKVDVHRVYMLREALTWFDYEDESIEDLRMLLMRCLVSPVYVKTEDGRRFVSFVFGLSRQLMKSGLAILKAQIPLGSKSVLEGFGDILFRAWKNVEQDLKGEIEDGFLQGIIDIAIHARTCAFAASLRRVLGGFISQRTTQGVEKLLFRLAEPILFRSLQVPNSNVRLNALHLLVDLFPMEDPDTTKEENAMVLDKQFYLFEKLMNDECPKLRSVAVEGLCRVFNLFWEVIPPSRITKIITILFNDMSQDSCSQVRRSTVKGLTFLLENPQSYGLLKVFLPRLEHLLDDDVNSVRLAMVGLLRL